jgi:hypothetical protein
MTSEGEPDPKKIRSSEPDLKVVIGSEAGEAGTADGAEHEGEVTKLYNSPSLAAKSKYIDALLAAPMKESNSRTITFPDIPPATWELMMKLIDDPVASRTMMAEDVAKVAKYYDKYEFIGGTKLCDHVLEEYFKGVSADLGTTDSLIPAPDVDFIVDSVAVAKNANLRKAFAAGMQTTMQMLRSNKVPVGRTAFSVEHMKKLAPLMNEADCDVSLPVVGSHTPGHYDLESDGFPEKFVGDCTEYLAHQTLISWMSHIELTGSHFEDFDFVVHGNGFGGRPAPVVRAAGTDGNFAQDGDDYSFSFQNRHMAGRGSVSFEGDLQNVFIRRRNKEEGWSVLFTKEADDGSIVETLAYKAPLSGNLSIPPSNGWVSAHPFAKGNLKLTYHLNGTTEA